MFLFGKMPGIGGAFLSKANLLAHSCHENVETYILCTVIILPIDEVLQEVVSTSRCVYCTMWLWAVDSVLSMLRALCYVKTVQTRRFFFAKSVFTKSVVPKSVFQIYFSTIGVSHTYFSKIGVHQIVFYKICVSQGGVFQTMVSHLFFSKYVSPKSVFQTLFFKKTWFFS